MLSRFGEVRLSVTGNVPQYSAFGIETNAAGQVSMDRLLS